MALEQEQSQRVVKSPRRLPGTLPASEAVGGKDRWQLLSGRVHKSEVRNGTSLSFRSAVDLFTCNIRLAIQFCVAQTWLLVMSVNL